jgi:hypothetical protein
MGVHETGRSIARPRQRQLRHASIQLTVDTCEVASMGNKAAVNRLTTVVAKR